MGSLDDREILELRQLCTSGGLAQDSLASLIDASLSVPTLVKSEAAAMANAKKAGLGLAERNKLREALRRHKDNVLSAVEPEIVEIGDDAEAHHIVAAQHHMMEVRRKLRAQADEESKGIEVVKNGNICAGYRWTQELGELTVAIELPPGTAKRDVTCKITPGSLEAGLRGQQRLHRVHVAALRRLEPGLALGEERRVVVVGHGRRGARGKPRWQRV